MSFEPSWPTVGWALSALDGGGGPWVLEEVDPAAAAPLLLLLPVEWRSPKSRLDHRPRLFGSVESIFTTLNLSLGPWVAPLEVAVVATYLAASRRDSQCTAMGALGGWNGRGGEAPLPPLPPLVGWK